MKHVLSVTKSIPAQASIFPEGHPSLLDSVKGLMEDPMGTIQQHLQKG